MLSEKKAGNFIVAGIIALLEYQLYKTGMLSFFPTELDSVSKAMRSDVQKGPHNPSRTC